MAPVLLSAWNDVFPVIYPNVGAEICKFWRWLMHAWFALWVGSAVVLPHWTISNAPLESCLPINHSHRFWFEVLHFLIPKAWSFRRKSVHLKQNSPGAWVRLFANVFVPCVHFQLPLESSQDVVGQSLLRDVLVNNWWIIKHWRLVNEMWGHDTPPWDVVNIPVSNGNPTVCIGARQSTCKECVVQMWILLSLIL